MKNIYIYPAIFSFEDDGISIEFPGLDGAYTCGDTEEEALYMAKDCLGLHLHGMEEDGEEIPAAPSIKDIKTEGNQAIVMIKVNMKVVRGDIDNRMVKKTLTIPNWLNEKAVEKGINFSATLRSALMEELEIEN